MSAGGNSKAPTNSLRALTGFIFVISIVASQEVLLEWTLVSDLYG